MEFRCLEERTALLLNNLKRCGFFDGIVGNGIVKVRCKFDGSFSRVIDSSEAVHQFFEGGVAGIVRPFVSGFGEERRLKLA